MFRPFWFLTWKHSFHRHLSNYSKICTLFKISWNSFSGSVHYIYVFVFLLVKLTDKILPLMRVTMIWLKYGMLVMSGIIPLHNSWRGGGEGGFCNFLLYMFEVGGYQYIRSHHFLQHALSICKMPLNMKLHHKIKTVFLFFYCMPFLFLLSHYSKFSF